MSTEIVQITHKENELIRPRYESDCFSNIPGFIQGLLTNGRDQPKSTNPIEILLGDLPRSYNNVVLLFLDSFGWIFLEKYISAFPFLERFARDGVVSKIHSQFPSTTAAHVSTIHSGLKVSEHGIYDCCIYEPKVDTVLNAFSLKGYYKSNPDDFSDIAGSVYPSQTIYSELRRKKINSHIYQSESEIHSPLSSALFCGAQVHGYTGLEQGLSKMTEQFNAAHGQAYHYFYYNRLDKVAHLSGIDSKEFMRELCFLMNSLESFISNLASSDDTLLILTADHGQVPIDPEKTIYLNNDCPELTQYLKRENKGDPILPTGSCRDCFLHVEDEAILECKEMLSDFFGERALVIETEELILDGFFGNTVPYERFVTRIGNLTILPQGDNSVWWYEGRRIPCVADHGGLSKEEIEVPLMFLGI